ncbi:MAG: hypothetical protein LBP26_00115 [Clostridiales bacterium]|jgi:uncharacterized membrane protein|nr:hypothetical protein [Clostridiales bacterium]
MRTPVKIFNKVALWARSRRNLIPTLLAAAAFALLSAGVLWLNAARPVVPTLYNSETISYEKAVVTAVIEESLEEAEDLPGRMIGRQIIKVRFKSGAMKGAEVEVENILVREHSIRVSKGTRVVIKTDMPGGVYRPILVFITTTACREFLRRSAYLWRLWFWSAALRDFAAF